MPRNFSLSFLARSPWRNSVWTFLWSFMRISIACPAGERLRDVLPVARDALRVLRDADDLPCAPRRCAVLAPPLAPARLFAEDLPRVALRFEDLLRLRVVAMT